MTCPSTPIGLGLHKESFRDLQSLKISRTEGNSVGGDSFNPHGADFEDVVMRDVDIFSPEHDKIEDGESTEETLVLEELNNLVCCFILGRPPRC